MIIHPTEIQGVYRIELELRGDYRGYFTRVFDLNEIRKYIPNLAIVNINRSLTKEQGTIRGIHYQRAPKAEDKIVQCLQGKIFDVAVDLRPESPTYRKWTSAELTEENMNLFVIPKGCGHAFQALTPDCLVEYFVSEFYSPEHEGGVRWNDPAIGIMWPIPNAKTSEKDANWPLLA